MTGLVRAGFLFTILGVLAPATTSAQTCTEIVSVSSSGEEGVAMSERSSCSEDGRYVAFTSEADNLVPGDTNGIDVFVHDRATGQTTRVSVDSNGAEGNQSSAAPSISADGRYVAFISAATNLVPGDTNNATDAFVHDRTTGQTERVSLSSGGAQANNGSHDPSISADGRYVAFSSWATNLVAGDTNDVEDVFVHDRATAQTTRVSVATGGGEGSAFSAQPSISADGRYVAFESLADGLVPGDTNGGMDVFVHDRTTGETVRVSVASGGDQGNNWSRAPSISANGRFVAFFSYATNLVPGDTNAHPDVFVHDLLSDETTMASVDSSADQGNRGSRTPSISGDGQVVAFQSEASDLVVGDTNGFEDVFVHDRTTGLTRRVSVDSGGGQADSGSGEPAISSDGRFVAFESFAGNLVPGDDNDVTDVFVSDAQCRVGTPYCFGDGSGTDCPCLNAGAADEGCANGTGAGAVLSATGSASVAAADLVLEGRQLPAHQPGLFFQADEAVGGGAGVSFGDGLRCAGGNVVRLEVRSSDGAGHSATTVDIATRGGVSAGEIKRYQLWYRDPAGSPCGSSFNLSNAYEILWRA